MLISFILLIFIDTLKNPDKETTQDLYIDVMDIEKNDESDVFRIKYKIYNLNNSAKQIPPIKILFLDDNNYYIYMIIIFWIVYTYFSIN
jgi:hypothetical protein